MPRPPSARSSEPLICENISNMRGSIEGSMPMPQSFTAMTTSDPSRRAASSMRPPASEYLDALVSRLARTCASRRGSASSHNGSAGKAWITICRRSSTSGSAVSSAVAMATLNSTRCRRSSSLPRVIRETSSRSSSSSAMCRTCRSITSWLQRRCSVLAPGERARRAAWRIGASGLRSSCASVARNSSLRRSASRSASDASIKSVMSGLDPTAPMNRPSTEKRGAPIDWIQRHAPSLRGSEP